MANFVLKSLIQWNERFLNIDVSLNFMFHVATRFLVRELEEISIFQFVEASWFVIFNCFLVSVVSFTVKLRLACFCSSPKFDGSSWISLALISTRLHPRHGQVLGCIIVQP